MIDKFKKLFKKAEQDEKYILVPQSEINIEMKRKIIELGKKSRKHWKRTSSH